MLEIVEKLNQFERSNKQSTIRVSRPADDTASKARGTAARQFAARAWTKVVALAAGDVRGRTITITIHNAFYFYIAKF